MKKKKNYKNSKIKNNMKKFILILIVILFYSCKNETKETEETFKYELYSVVYLKNEPVIITYRVNEKENKIYEVKLLNCKSVDYNSCRFTVNESELTNNK